MRLVSARFGIHLVSARFDIRLVSARFDMRLVALDVDLELAPAASPQRRGHKSGRSRDHGAGGAEEDEREGRLGRWFCKLCPELSPSEPVFLSSNAGDARWRRAISFVYAGAGYRRPAAPARPWRTCAPTPRRHPGLAPRDQLDARTRHSRSRVPGSLRRPSLSTLRRTASSD